MPAPKIFDISQYGKKTVKRFVEKVVKTGEMDLGRDIQTIIEVEQEFEEITPWITVKNAVELHNELGPFDWKEGFGGMCTACDNGVDKRRFILTKEQYAEFVKAIEKPKFSAPKEKDANK